MPQFLVAIVASSEGECFSQAMNLQCHKLRPTLAWEAEGILANYVASFFAAR